jgi:hypothetical protein
LKRALGLAVLFLLAAAYMRLGLFIPINWHDEGVIVYPIWRVAEGELPYRDFQQMYGPSVFFLNGLLFRLFGPDLAVLRYFLLALKASTCVMVYLAARQVSGRAFAWIAYALSVVLAGLVWPVSTVPYASFFGTALCLGGLLAFLASERRFVLGCAVAGLCFGLAATFKQTSGAFAFLALALYLLVDEGRWATGPRGIFARLVGASRWLVLLIVAGVSILYLAPRNPVWNFALLVTPVLFLTFHLAWLEIRRDRDPANELRGFWGMVALSLAFLLPPVTYALLFMSLGLGDEILFNVVSGIPSAVTWIKPYPTPTSNFVLWQLACLGSFASAAVWHARTAEAGRGWRSWMFAGLLAVTLFALGSLAVEGWNARARNWWFWASSDLLFGLPFIAVWLSLVGMVREGRGGKSSADPGRRRPLFLFTCYGTMALLWLFPAADIWHILPLLPSCLPLLAYWLDRFWKLPGAEGSASRTGQVTAGVLIGIFGLALVIPAIHDVLRERRMEPGFAQPLGRATGIRGGSSRGYYENGAKVVRYLVAAEHRDEPVFVLSGKQLFYFLADRVSPMQEFEYILYLSAYDAIRKESARAWVDQAEIIHRLKEQRPLIVDDSSDGGSQNVRRMFPQLGRFIDTQYQLEKKFGAFRVLRMKTPRARP